MTHAPHRHSSWLAILASLFLISAAARATTLVRLRFPDLVHYASAIARVRCVGADIRVENGEIFTDTRFHVLETEKGQLPAQIVVRQPGGTYQHLHSHVEGAPEFRMGEEVYLFLWGRPGRQFFVLGWSQGTFRLHRDALSGKFARSASWPPTSHPAWSRPAVDRRRASSAARNRPAEFCRGRRRQPFQRGLQIADDGQPLVPSPLQLGGNEAVVGIDGIILTPRMADLVAGLLERQLHLPPLVLAGAAAHRLCRECGLDSERLQALDHLGADFAIDPHAARMRCSDRHRD